MTLRITATGVTATNPIRYIKRVPPPVALDAFFFTQDSLALAAKNCVTGGADATVVGSPAVSSSVITLTDGNYIDTGVAETASITLIAVVRRNNQQVMLMGTHSSADSNATILATNGAAPRKPFFQTRATSAPALVSAAEDWTANPSGLELIIGKVDAVALTQSLYIPRTGERISGVITGSRILSGRNICIGAGPSPGTAYAGDTTHGAAYGVATRAISDAEEDQLYAWLKKRIAGI
jgi:hypothetical protein